jgi:hypothetical protein
LSFRASHDHTGPAHLHHFGVCGQYTQRGGASDRRGGRDDPFGQRRPPVIAVGWGSLRCRGA